MIATFARHRSKCGNPSPEFSWGRETNVPTQSIHTSTWVITWNHPVVTLGRGVEGWVTFKTCTKYLSAFFSKWAKWLFEGIRLLFLTPRFLHRKRERISETEKVIPPKQTRVCLGCDSLTGQVTWLLFPERKQWWENQSVRARARALFFRWGTMRARARALFFRWGLPESVAGCHSLAGGTLWGGCFFQSRKANNTDWQPQKGAAASGSLGIASATPLPTVPASGSARFSFSHSFEAPQKKHSRKAQSPVPSLAHSHL